MVVCGNDLTKERGTRRSDSNCINLIRLLAAIQVFLGHAQAHLDVNVVPDFIFDLLSVLQGVPVFYVLSGFLIWDSIQRTKDFKQFCKKRIFRLYPELWGGVLLNFVLIIVLFGSQIKWAPYLVFQLTQGSVLQFWTPDFLRDYGCGTPNGSLPTILVMLQAYLVMWLLYPLLHGKSIWRWVVALLLGIVLNFSPMAVSKLPVAVVAKLFRQTMIPFFWLFLFGMAINEFFDYCIKWLKRLWPIFLVLAAAVVIADFDITVIYGLLKCSLMAPAIIGFAYSFPKIRIKNDYSYGIFIYHMIVVNGLIQLGFKGKIWAVFAAAIITIILAMVSYHTVGALSRKKRKDLAK